MVYSATFEGVLHGGRQLTDDLKDFSASQLSTEKEQIIPGSSYGLLQVTIRENTNCILVFQTQGRQS